MKAELKEFKDKNGTVFLAVINVIIPPSDPLSSMDIANKKLENFINNYVESRPHNVYVHSKKDTVSSIIYFDLDEYQGENFEL